MRNYSKNSLNHLNTKKYRLGYVCVEVDEASIFIEQQPIHYCNTLL